jgi:hypothetical protein
VIAYVRYQREQLDRASTFSDTSVVPTASPWAARNRTTARGGAARNRNRRLVARCGYLPITKQLDELKARAILEPTEANVIAYVRYQREQLGRSQ